MRVSKGGTDMYCPVCDDITTCKAVPAAQVTGKSGGHAQRMFYEKHPDIQFFRRGRECLSCGHEFLTAEVDLDFLEELINLREALSSIKKNAEAYTKESAAASASLAKLSESLRLLKALKIYKQAK